MASMRLTVRVSVVSILLASLVLMGSGVMASGAASASPSSCYPPGSTSCTGKLTAIPSTVVRGGNFTITGKGFNAGAKVSINICGIETINTTASDVGVTGLISVSVTMPVKAPLGPCKLTATGLGTNKQTLTLTATVTVTAVTVRLGSYTVLKLSAAKVTYGHEHVELLSVTVSPLSPGFTPTGTVTVKESTTTGWLCKINLSSGNGTCRLSKKQLAVGTYSLVAIYGGSSVYLGSTSAKETLTVVKPTSKTALKLSSSEVTYGHEQLEVLSVTVSPQYSGTPTGTVTITGTRCLITLSSGKGSCTLSSKKFNVGNNYLVATYSGSTNFKGSTSAKETLTVVK